MLFYWMPRRKILINLMETRSFPLNRPNKSLISRLRSHFDELKSESIRVEKRRSKAKQNRLGNFYFPLDSSIGFREGNLLNGHRSSCSKDTLLDFDLKWSFIFVRNLKSSIAIYEFADVFLMASIVKAKAFGYPSISISSGNASASQ